MLEGDAVMIHSFIVANNRGFLYPHIILRLAPFQ